MKKNDLLNNSIKPKEIIRFNNVCFAYINQKTYCLDNISFSINEGEKILIFGSNGAGKSTISKLICGILKQNKGDIFINNTLLTDDNVNTLRKDIGLIFQNPDDQFIGTTVRDDIAFGLENNLVPPKEMDDIINYYAKKVGMDDFLSSQPENLSGGQKQRVALASTLARKPKILILDEATSMLDPTGKKIIDNLIKDVSKEYCLTLIKITHELDDLEFYDKVIILDKGKILKIEETNKIFSDIKTLNQANLELPYFLKLKNKLGENNIELRNVNSEESLIKSLCQLKLKN